MPKIPYPARDLDQNVAAKVGTLEVLTCPNGMKFKLEVEIDAKLEKEAGSKDPLLKAEMWEKVNEVYDDLVERIADNLRKTDRGAVQLRDTNQLEKMQKLVEVVNRGIVGARDIAQDKAEKAVLAHWNELCKKKKEYLKYKIKIVATIVGAGAGLITSIGLMAGTPFTGGASAALSIIGMVKSVTTIVKEIASASQTVLQSIKVLEVQVEVVQKKWDETKSKFGNKATGHAWEVSQTVFESFVGVSLPSIKSCLSNLDTAKKKLTGVEVKNHDIAKSLNKVLEKMDDLKRDFLAEAKKRLEKHPSPLAIKQLPLIDKNLDTVLKPTEDEVNNLIISIHANHKTIKEATEKLKPVEEQVKAIAKMRALKAYEVLDNLLTVKDLGLAALSGNNLVSGTKSVMENVGPALGSFSYDKVWKVGLEGTFLEKNS